MKIYTVMINGIEHTMQLNAEDAKRYDAVEVKAAKTAENDEKAAPAPANKARQPSANK